MEVEEATSTIEYMEVEEEPISNSSLPVPPEDMEVEQEAANTYTNEIFDMALSHASHPASMQACACSVHPENTVKNTLLGLMDALKLLLTKQPPADSRRDSPAHHNASHHRGDVCRCHPQFEVLPTNCFNPLTFSGNHRSRGQ